MNTNYNNNVAGALKLITVNGSLYQLGKDASVSEGGITKLYNDFELYKAATDGAYDAKTIHDKIDTLAASVAANAATTITKANTEQYLTIAETEDISGRKTYTLGTTGIDGAISTAIATVVNGAPAAFDTLKEIADWILDDTTGAASVIAKKADKVDNATSGNFASLDANGNITDSGHTHTDYKTVQTATTDPTANGNAVAFIDTLTQNALGVITATKKAVTLASSATAGLMSAAHYNKIESLATVATSGSYNDLTDAPLIPNLIDNNGYEYVDLGLPSGTLWAKYDVGAGTHSHDFVGHYYQLGQGAKKYYLDAATPLNAMYTGTENPIDLSVDTARQVMGGAWHMPTLTQIQELIDNTTHSWTTAYMGDSPMGMVFTGNNGNKLFIPAMGYLNGVPSTMGDTSVYKEMGEEGYILSSTLPNGSDVAYLTINHRLAGTAYEVQFASYSQGRLYGYSARGVLDRIDAFHKIAFTGDYNDLNNAPTIPEIPTIPNKVSDLENDVPYLTEADLKTIDANGHDYVDLGLPSGTKWATMNVGASSETDYGNYYQYGKGAAQYAATSGDSNYGGTEDPLDSFVDTASQVWGGSWHMPTRAQMEELTANTTYQWVTNYKGSGINGGTFTATNGAVLFIPAAGYWDDGSQYDVGGIGSYWGSSPDGSNTAYDLYFYNGDKGVGGNGREYGYSVRGVLDTPDKYATEKKLNAEILRAQTAEAQLIETKADKSSLATVATTGSYEDLENKPVIEECAAEDLNMVQVVWNPYSFKYRQTSYGNLVVDNNGTPVIARDPMSSSESDPNEYFLYYSDDHYVRRMALWMDSATEKPIDNIAPLYGLVVAELSYVSGQFTIYLPGYKKLSFAGNAGEVELEEWTSN